MKKYFLIPTILSLFLNTYSHADYFSDCHVTGSVTIYDLKHNRWFFSDPTDALKTTVPASTFKIPNSAIALEEHIVKDENETLPWDGKKREYEAWNQDNNLSIAYKNSTVWFYQRLAQKIGTKKYQYYLKKLHYGNEKFSNNINRFWLDSSLQISPKQQIEFLTALHQETLPFSKRTYSIVKKLIIEEQNNQYTLRAKTGWGVTKTQDIGWWVGYIEKKDNTYFFATRLTQDKPQKNPDFLTCRKTITYNYLKAQKILD
ncbi:class D beta-lactamase [Neisseria sp. Ec49-e6-T10]|uniref:class D beta-lactamase n=1 Tax=Neisseria sp. Ec49-e6-T10 TaxID=3140744 RepID=UPI003EBB0D4A